MKPLSLIVLFLGASFAQAPIPMPQRPVPPEAPGAENDVRLPNGKLQRDEIAKADYKKNLDDAIELARLAEELRADLEKETAFVVSLKTIKKTEDIEKLERNIRGRLKRF
jgi:hypothetical protein